MAKNNLKLSRGLTVEKCLAQMNPSLVKSIFNTVIAIADDKGWACLNKAEDVFGKPAIEDEPELYEDEGFEDELMHAETDY